MLAKINIQAREMVTALKAGEFGITLNFSIGMPCENTKDEILAW